MIQTAVMVVVITVCAWITIPLAVPFTLQTFAVFLSLRLLGGKWGSCSILVYLLLGAVGVPVFAGFKGGVGALLGPTGGYLLGFLICALLYWLLEKPCRAKARIEDLVLLCGLFLCYAFGTAWFVYVMGMKNGAGSMGIVQALLLCVVPFIIPDLVKLWLSGMLARRVMPLIPLAGRK
jgi:biotin transport system substrate-specific component